MSINQKIAKIPLWILYSIICFFVAWDFIFTYFSLKNNPRAYESNPINAFFVRVFGLEYFIYGLPIVLLVLFLAIKLGGYIVSKLEKREYINGENHVAMAIICLSFPNILHQIIIVILGRKPLAWWNFRTAYLIGLSLFIIYITITEYDLARLKKK